MGKILISACLIGELVKYDGGHNRSEHQIIQDWMQQDLLSPLCPEMAGGLPAPREPAEIQNGDGNAVLDGTARVLTVSGQDVTAQFLAGAEKMLQLALSLNIKVAVLKARSPSCGNDTIYNGQYNHTQIPGSGVTAALLKRHDIAVFNEDQIKEAADWLDANLKLLP